MVGRAPTNKDGVIKVIDVQSKRIKLYNPETKRHEYINLAGGHSGVSGEEIEQAVKEYLDENPPVGDYVTSSALEAAGEMAAAEALAILSGEVEV